MTGAMGHLRRTPWAGAAAVYAWCVVIGLTVLIQLGTLALALPPALLATVPVAVPSQRQPVIMAIAAAALAVWALVGTTLLGSYFLPSAILLGIEYVRVRAQQSTRQ